MSAMMWKKTIFITINLINHLKMCRWKNKVFDVHASRLSASYPMLTLCHIKKRWHQKKPVNSCKVTQGVRQVNMRQWHILPFILKKTHTLYCARVSFLPTFIFLKFSRALSICGVSIRPVSEQEPLLLSAQLCSGRLCTSGDLPSTNFCGSIL